ATPAGDAIRIEERHPDEVRAFGGRVTAPTGSPVRNPAFDVTPARLVTAIVTEVGIARRPYGRSLASHVHPASRSVGPRLGRDTRPGGWRPPVRSAALRSRGA